MDEILKYLNSNPVNMLFLILALLSIAVSIILYFRSKKERRPVYDKKSFNLITNQTSKVKGLRITHNDQQVKDLTLTKFALWNLGRETINRGDVAPSDKLRLRVGSEYKILQAGIAYAKTAANNFSVVLSDDQQAVLIDFDYFHTNEGVIVNVYHTGSANEHVQLEGTIKGVAQITLGSIEKDFLVRRFLDSTLGKVVPRGKNFRPRHYPLALAFCLVTLPILIVIVPVDIFRNLVKKVPKDF